MNEETKIKLQAHLDGELTGREAHEISDLLAKDREAQLIMGELRFVKNALAGNEMEIKLPETREFFWSKIERQIEREAKQSQPEEKVAWWKLKYLRMISGAAAACALLLVSFIAFRGENFGVSAMVAGEIEGTGEEMGMITYRSNADGMTVVYLFDREPVEMVDFE